MMILAKRWSCEQQANAGQSWGLDDGYNWTRLSGADASKDNRLI